LQLLLFPDGAYNHATNRYFVCVCVFRAKSIEGHEVCGRAVSFSRKI